MADKTANYKLVKPDENDFYDINVFNDNADVLDKEIHKLDVPEFEDYTGEETVVPSAEEALQSMVKGKKLMELLGSMKAFCKGVVTIGKLANRFDVVEEGYALDARAGKTLFDQVAQLNSDYVDTNYTLSTTPGVAKTLPVPEMAHAAEIVVHCGLSNHILVIPCGYTTIRDDIYNGSWTSYVTGTVTADWTANTITYTFTSSNPAISGGITRLSYRK